jgi:dihydrofolate synthase / folylpolyglutamate synthase
MKISSYDEAVKSLYRLQKFGIKFGLSKTANLLEALGNPHKGQHYLHVAGTNGKGSVAAYLSAILKGAGFKVGLYSSPHLVRFTERFKINDEEISREQVRILIQELTEAFSPVEPPTFFEATTALAMSYFSREKTDIAIMEVGMGGRLDATNVISPLVSVITNISLEHQAYLGPRLLDIAGEKAGIIKDGVDLVTGVDQPSVIRLIKAIAKEKNSRVWRVGKDTRYRMTGSGLHYYGKDLRLTGLELGLKGNFQGKNAALALTTIERLLKKGFKIPLHTIRLGLAATHWPGRMQIVRRDPTIILDGAHNPGAMKTVAGALQAGFKYNRLILVIGIMEDKDIDGVLNGIVPMSDFVLFTRPVYARAATPEVLAAKAKHYHKPGEVVPHLTEALGKAEKIADPHDLILVTGSLFTVGEALSYYYPETYRPETV